MVMHVRKSPQCVTHVHIAFSLVLTLSDNHLSEVLWDQLFTHFISAT